MKTLFKNALAVTALAGLAATTAAHAQGFPMQPAPQTACATRLGVFPFYGGIPGAPCGNGVDFGMTIVLPPMPQPQQMPQFPQPSNGGWSGAAGIPGTSLPSAPLGPQGQLAGLLGANREMQLAAECTSAGPPQAVAACISGRLTQEELQKCANGIGSPNGCFGPNNTLRIHIENVLSDIVNGPGDSNDLTGKNGFTCKQLGICL